MLRSHQSLEMLVTVGIPLRRMRVIRPCSSASPLQRRKTVFGYRTNCSVHQLIFANLSGTGSPGQGLICLCPWGGGGCHHLIQLSQRRRRQTYQKGRNKAWLTSLLSPRYNCASLHAPSTKEAGTGPKGTPAPKCHISIPGLTETKEDDGRNEPSHLTQVSTVARQVSIFHFSIVCKWAVGRKGTIVTLSFKYPEQWVHKATNCSITKSCVPMTEGISSFQPSVLSLFPAPELCRLPLPSSFMSVLPLAGGERHGLAQAHCALSSNLGGVKEGPRGGAKPL